LIWNLGCYTVRALRNVNSGNTRLSQLVNVSECRCLFDGTTVRWASREGERGGHRSRCHQDGGTRATQLRKPHDSGAALLLLIWFIQTTSAILQWVKLCLMGSHDPAYKSSRSRVTRVEIYRIRLSLDYAKHLLSCTSRIQQKYKKFLTEILATRIIEWPNNRWSLILFLA
jgi:hypothetical protein